MFICEHLIFAFDQRNTAEIREILRCTPNMYYLLAVSHRSAWLPQHSAVKTISETDRENQNDPVCRWLLYTFFVWGMSISIRQWQNIYEEFWILWWSLSDFQNLEEPRRAVSHRRTKLTRNKSIIKTQRKKRRLRRARMLERGGWVRRGRCTS